VYTSICVKKFYDANTNGLDDDGIVVSGFKVVLSGAASATGYTNSAGVYCFTGLLPGNYTVTEVAPNSSWQNTTPKSVTVTGLTCPQAVKFGNVCLGAGGGNTPGFWQNSNGQALITAADLCALTALNLRNADGTNFDPVPAASCPNLTSTQVSDGKTALKNWIKNSSATNMAYMLSVHLASMTLNVRHGFVSGNAFVFAGSNPSGCTVPVNALGFITINDLMADADAELLTHNLTTVIGDPTRNCQEFKKNALDRANNNQNFVQATPCPFRTPY